MCTGAGALLLLDKDRRIIILAPDLSKNQALASVVKFTCKDLKRYIQRFQNSLWMVTWKITSRLYIAWAIWQGGMSLKKLSSNSRFVRKLTFNTVQDWKSYHKMQNSKKQFYTDGCRQTILIEEYWIKRRTSSWIKLKFSYSMTCFQYNLNKKIDCHRIRSFKTGSNQCFECLNCTCKEKFEE